MQLARRTVSPVFRNLIAETFPGLNLNPAYWRLMEHLLFGTWRDEDFGLLIASRELIAAIEGKQAQLAARNYSARAFLDAFSRDVVTIAWGGDNRFGGMARVITFIDFPPHILIAREDEMRGQWRDGGRVYFDDGTMPSRAKQQAEREAVQREAQEQTARAGCDEERILLDYMNSLPPHRFTKVLRHMDAAYEAAAGIEHAETRRQQLSLLRVIAQQPQPFYQPSGPGRTVRIFSLNESLLGLKREIRCILTQDWIEFDLRYCHFAIGARLWDVPEAQDFLASGQNLWDHLSFGIGRDDERYSAVKAVLKDGVYSAMYGMSIPNLVRQVTTGLQEFGIERGGTRFIAHPLIRAMLTARNRVMRQIKNQGGAITCFGSFLSLKDYSARSILAQVSQAVELQLLFPVVELALQNRDRFAITLWQHDGFSIDVRDPAREEYWKRRIKEVVNDRKLLIGIHTMLEEIE